MVDIAVVMVKGIIIYIETRIIIKRLRNCDYSNYLYNSNKLFAIMIKAKLIATVSVSYIRQYQHRRQHQHLKHRLRQHQRRKYQRGQYQRCQYQHRQHQRG